MKSILASLATTLLVSTFASAQVVQFGDMISGGTGCPATADKKPYLQISNQHGTIYFNDYSLKTSAQLVDRKSCNIRLPISIVAGYQVGVKVIDLVGYVAQPKKMSSSVSAIVSLVGAEAQDLTKTWTTKINNNFHLQNDLASGYTWSSCFGKDTMLTMNSNIITQRTKVSQKSSISLDEINFDFIVRRCAN
jgi:hypothetical protein